MRIRKLELHGFKSFPDRTTLHFGSGISVVVGPNGCGKSNIVDAIKWCIGEQSAKSLRGDDMLDVIFGGSTDRPKVGFAEVALTFTAEGGEPLPGEYARFTEVSVGRRLHRDGTSDYIIQGNKARRKDILDFFLDTGVGNNLYSFIEQGRIGEIVHASPEKRRLLLDEAAGISRYKARRDEAQQRLEDTAGQLDRAADVTDEMGRRLSLLEAQVLRAARFRRARGLVRQLEIYLALAKYADQLDARRADQHELQRVKDEADGLDREVNRRELDIQQRQSELDVLEQGVVTWRDEVAELDASLREQEGAKNYNERSRAETDDEIVRHHALLAEAEADHAAAASEAAINEANGEGIAADIGVAEARLADGRRQHEAALQRRQIARDALAVLDRELAAAVSVTATLAAREEELSRRIGAIPASRDRVSGSLDAARREHAALAEKSAKAAFALASRKRAVEVARDVVGGAEREVAARVAEEAAARADLERVEAESQKARKASDAEVQQATDAVGKAEKRARDALADAERRAADRVRAAQAESEAAVEAEQLRVRKAIRDAEERAAAWTKAAETVALASLDTQIAQIEGADRALADAAAAASSAEERRLLAGVTAAEIEAQDAGQRRIGLATAARDAAVTESESASQRQAAAEARAAALEREQAEITGKRRGLLAQAEAERDGERGAVAVRKVIPGATPLVERRPLSEDESWIPRAMGERLLVPATTSMDEVRRAAAAAKTAGPASILLLPQGDPLGRLVEAVRTADHLDAALAMYADSGAAVLVPSTGERIDADGWIHLGATGQAAEAAVRRRRELVAIEARIAELADLVVAAANARATALSARDAARTAVTVAEKALRAEEADVREATKRVVDAARSAARNAIDALGVARARGEQQRRDVREPKIAELRRAFTGRNSENAASVQQSLRAVREAHEIAIEQARAGVIATVDAARAAATTSVADARKAGDAEIVAARGTVEVLRAAGARDEEGRRARIGVVRQELDAARGRRQEADGLVNRVRSEQFAADVALARAEGDLGSIAATEERLRARILELEGQLVNIEREAEQLAEQSTRLRADRTEADTRRAVSEERRSRAAAERGLAEADEEKVRGLLGQSDVLLAGLRERARSAESTAEKAQLRATDAVARAARLRLRLDTLADGRTATFDNEAAIRARLAELAERREAASERLNRDRERAQVTRKGIKDLEAAWRERLARRETVLRAVAETEAHLSAVIADIEIIRRRIDERYQVSLAAVLDRLDAMRAFVLEPDATIREPVEVGGDRVPGVEPMTLRPDALSDGPRLAEALETLNTLRDELADIGEVNLAAFDEYRELAARFADLSSQRADLEASVESIRGAIAKMNRTCRERFRDAFDRVNENFQRAYPRLVGGGSARLALTDEEDLLETGVDIFVQPPGKRLQNLTLLSGGEKAMAAIALLLSLFQVKPSPFCLLDEVDAPLDEANGARFNDMLREMSGMTQFIVITHNRKTMEAADTLYGITMPTPGVSRLVSVRLGE